MQIESLIYPLATATFVVGGFLHRIPHPLSGQKPPLSTRTREVFMLSGIKQRPNHSENTCDSL